MPDKKAEKPDYKRSLLTLRGINAIEEERRIPQKRLFELFDNCMKDIVAELKTPHLSNMDKADALIASITATNILLNELGLEEEPLRELIVQLRNRHLGSPDNFVFNQSPRPIRPKTPFYSDLNVAFCKHGAHPVYRVLLYHEIGLPSRHVELSNKGKYLRSTGRIPHS